jgi:hypothetical protein
MKRLAEYKNDSTTMFLARSLVALNPGANVSRAGEA